MFAHNKYLLSYWKFISLSQTLRETDIFQDLDPVEERLLNVLSHFWKDRQKITILEAMRLPLTVSNTTVHRRLTSLRLKGLIELKVDHIDNRIKYILPSDLTKQYFDRLGRTLASAVGNLPIKK